MGCLLPGPKKETAVQRQQRIYLEKRRAYERRQINEINENNRQKQEMKRRVKKQGSGPIDVNKICTNLYLGNANTARDRNWLNENNIKYLVNVSKTPSLFDDEIDYLKIMIEDQNYVDIEKYFKSAIQGISQHIKEGGVLVHT
eukprot:UN07642